MGWLSWGWFPGSCGGSPGAPLEVLGFSEALLRLLWCVPWGSLGGSGLSEALLGLWRWVSQGSLGGCGLSEALWRWVSWSLAMVLCPLKLSRGSCSGSPRTLSLAMTCPSAVAKYWPSGPLRVQSRSSPDPAVAQSRSCPGPVLSSPGPVLVQSRSCPGPVAQVLSWSFPGPVLVLVQSWSSPGPVLVPSGSGPGPFQVLSWSCPGPVPLGGRG